MRTFVYVLIILNLHLIFWIHKHLLWTPQLCDVHQQQSEYMEPITTLRNIEAAKRAAQKGSRTSGITNITNVRWNRTYAIQNRIGRCTQSLCNQYRRVNRKIKRQVEACLNGNRPYSLSCRFTGVNVSAMWFGNAYLPLLYSYLCIFIV